MRDGTHANRTVRDVTKVGQQELWFEPGDDFIYVIQNGIVNAAEATEVTAIWDKYRKQNGGVCFVLADHRNATGVTAEARSIFVHSEAVRSGFHLAAYGQPFVLRAIGNLVVKGMQMAAQTSVAYAAVADKDTAYAWLRAQKAAHIARSAPA